ncbi:hypothetical protein KC19_12G100100 [Ceratodon purpureus]|uniref:Uncharacterized protein n=1 Tax=Ceratodon purpureus TaxID=3225 RepID=A0A8T0G7W6_CERPU|nr:hypothetical protein KC19_12G100100 [Ceratodon purpureus]
MAMATFVASGTYLHSVYLPPQAAHLSCQKVSVTCTSACIGYCNRTIPWSRRRTREIRLRSSRDASKSSRRRNCWETRANGEIIEGDVVEYPLPEKVRQGGLYGDRSYGLGAVHELVSDNSSSSLVCHIEPLVMNDPPRATWIADERQDMVVVPLSQVRRLEAWLSMRMVDDRISNPHGEHAEHLWLVEEPLSERSGSPMYDEAPSNLG